jgi:hypothetical protein
MLCAHSPDLKPESFCPLQAMLTTFLWRASVEVWFILSGINLHLDS